MIFVADFESCDESMNGEKTNKHTDLSSLTIDNIIGQGKYGIVYKGQIVNQVITVLIMSNLFVKYFYASKALSFYMRVHLCTIMILSEVA